MIVLIIRVEHTPAQYTNRTISGHEYIRISFMLNITFVLNYVVFVILLNSLTPIFVHTFAMSLNYCITQLIGYTKRIEIIFLYLMVVIVGTYLVNIYWICNN